MNVKSAFHEFGHDITISKVGDYMTDKSFSFHNLSENNEQFRRYIDLLKMTKEGILLSDKRKIGEIIAEDFRIEHARRHNHISEVFPNSYTYSIDLRVTDLAKKKQQIIYDFLMGGKNE